MRYEEHRGTPTRAEQDASSARWLEVVRDRGLAGQMELLATRVQEGLRAGDKVTVPGLGAFSVSSRRAVPTTGRGLAQSEVHIPVFRPDRSFRDYLLGVAPWPPEEAPGELRELLAALMEHLRPDDAPRSARLGALGLLSLVHHEAHPGVHPGTGEPVQVPASHRPLFEPSLELRAALNRPPAAGE